MCGICGVIGGDAHRERGRVRAMARALIHRGPDDEGFYDGEHACLGNRRLAIIDVTGGRQPLTNEDETLWITFNGEVYNYRTLRADLEAAGHRFRTQTDTEVVLHLYERHGRDCLPRLRGMFAFAIWDRRQRRLFAARDRFGQKPFCYAVRGGRLFFASEIKALLAHGDVPVAPEPAAVDYYLAGRFVPAPLTMFRGIRKLPAAHWLEWCDGELRIERYWEPTFRVMARRPDADWIAELRARVEEAVRIHLVSDVPVGALLSGGLDSSVVVAAMAGSSGEPVRTFCIGSDAPGFDERRPARVVAIRFGTVHRERLVERGLLHCLPTLVRCMDEPSDPIAACMYEAARLAAADVKVVLGGDGGDEMFAGFDRYAAYQWVGRYAILPRWLRERVLRPLVRRAPGAHAYKSLGQRARWLDEVAGAEGGRRYALMTTHFRFGPVEKRAIYGPVLRREVATQDALAALAEPFEQAPAPDDLHRMLYCDMLTRLPEHTLLLADRMTMAHGLEARSPLLDHELAEFCGAMPARLKVRRGITKFALRRAARSWLPPETLRRPKQGFMLPIACWLDDAELGDVTATLRAGALAREGWIDGAGVDRLIAEHRRRRADHHVRIWMLLSLEAWYRIYMDGESVDGVTEHGVAARNAAS